ncbi:mucin-3/17 [Microdochium nivale]|nr:mucin-3/17 [Microdochium nivale]
MKLNVYAILSSGLATLALGGPAAKRYSHKCSGAYTTTSTIFETETATASVRYQTTTVSTLRESVTLTRTLSTIASTTIHSRTVVDPSSTTTLSNTGFTPAKSATQPEETSDLKTFPVCITTITSTVPVATRTVRITIGTEAASPPPITQTLIATYTTTRIIAENSATPPAAFVTVTTTYTSISTVFIAQLTSSITKTETITSDATPTAYAACVVSDGSSSDNFISRFDDDNGGGPIDRFFTARDMQQAYAASTASECCDLCHRAGPCSGTLFRPQDGLCFAFFVPASAAAVVCQGQLVLEGFSAATTTDVEFPLVVSNGLCGQFGYLGRGVRSSLAL